MASLLEILVDLDAVVARVGHHDVAVRGEADALRLVMV